MYNLSLQPASISAVEPDHLRSALVSLVRAGYRTHIREFQVANSLRMCWQMVIFLESCLQTVVRKRMSAYEVAVAGECGVTTLQTVVHQIYSSPKI